MTTKVTVDAHAGWPVSVVALENTPEGEVERELGVVAPGTVQDFYVFDTRKLVITELKRERN